MYCPAIAAKTEGSGAFGRVLDGDRKIETKSVVIEFADVRSLIAFILW